LIGLRAFWYGAGHMGMSRCQRAGALLLALALVIGTALGGVPVSGAARCRHCPPGCPMHAGRLGCHHAADAHNHQRREPAVRCTCGNHSEASNAPLPVFRAIIALRSESRPVVTRTSATRSVHALTTQFVLEPPTDPPRAALV
jgi:hypothetical protein